MHPSRAARRANIPAMRITDVPKLAVFLSAALTGLGCDETSPAAANGAAVDGAVADLGPAVDAAAQADGAKRPDAADDAAVSSDAQADMARPEPDAAVDAALSPDAAHVPMPDIMIDEAALLGNWWIDQKDFTEESCAVIEGCVNGIGRRTLLRFDVVTANVGDADLVMGRPERNEELFKYSACHDHHHFESYAQYGLLSPNGEIIVPGRKQAFCLLDWAQFLTEDPTVRSSAFFNCRFQGISRGWQDTYGGQLDCQWLDVTGVEPGKYLLDVQINNQGVLPDSDPTNNNATVRVDLPSIDITSECPEDAREGLLRSCGWQNAQTGRCASGDLVRIGCADQGQCQMGAACAGDPMMRICDGEGQCFPTTALEQSNNPCESECPYSEFYCPESGIYTVWLAPNADGGAFECELGSEAAPPPPVTGACDDESRVDGLDRNCDWTLGLDNVECFPGFDYYVGCNAACDPEVGVQCGGDPMLRVCKGENACTGFIAIEQNDDACGRNNVCPTARFTCPPSGRISALTAPYDWGSDARCELSLIRAPDHAD